MHYPAIATSIYITPSITITLLSSTSFYSARFTKVEFSWSCPIFPGGIMLPMQMARSQRHSLGDSEKVTSSFFLTCTETTCKTKATSLAAWSLRVFALCIRSVSVTVQCTVYTCDRKHFCIWLSVSYRFSAYEGRVRHRVSRIDWNRD